LDSRYNQHEIYCEAVIPFLEANRFRPSFRAIQKTRPITHRVKVLGRALLSARTESDSFWMLLSGNAEAAFTSTVAAADLPTPATAAAASIFTENVAVTASVVSPLMTTGSLPVAAAAAATSTATPSTTSASDTFAFVSIVATATPATAAANAATPSAGQKRKARLG
jgi:hypothetical protein